MTKIEVPEALNYFCSTLAWKIPWMEDLVGCSLWGPESDTTGWLQFHFSLSCIGEGNGKSLQCPCLGNPRDGGAWWAALYGVTLSRTRLKQLSSSSSRKIMGRTVWVFEISSILHVFFLQCHEAPVYLKTKENILIILSDFRSKNLTPSAWSVKLFLGKWTTKPDWWKIWKWIWIHTCTIRNNYIISIIRNRLMKKEKKQVKKVEERITQVPSERNNERWH